MAIAADPNGPQEDEGSHTENDRGSAKREPGLVARCHAPNLLQGERGIHRGRSSVCTGS